MIKLRMKIVFITLLCQVLVSANRRLENKESLTSRNNSLQNPKVCIDDGCLRGKIMEGYQAGSFNAFIGIPYAMPPTGKLRFANPVRNEAWESGTVYNATEDKPMCIQKNDLIPNAKVDGEEDCLYLNVYTPKVRGSLKTPLPVMVYIHGGAFFAGGASPSLLGPEYFMDTRRTILVTFQYRLGVFGFLSTGDEIAPGNFGLKDQVMALQWVKHNIAYFGGNPDQVTIFGQSAGGASVQMHMISPMSEGLFSKAIMMSGNAIAPWNIPTEDPMSLVRRQAKVVDIAEVETFSSKQLIDALRNTDAIKLSKSIEQLKFWSIDPLTLYRPVVEPRSSSNEAFLVEDPRVSWMKGSYQQIPWMTGYLPNDGAVRAIAITSNEQLLNELNANISYILPMLLEKQPSEELMKVLKDRYFNESSDEKWVTNENVQRFVDLFTEAAFLYPIQSAVKQHVTSADTKLAPVSIYKFSFKGSYSYSFLYTFTHQDFGVVHCDELIYLFRSPALFPDFPPKSKEARMSHNFVEFFIDFAINGVATPLKPYRECSNDNELYQSMDCDVLEFTNTNEPGKSFEVHVSNARNEDLFSFWRKFY